MLMVCCVWVVVQGFESLALKRLQRLHYLEAQIKQYRYNIHKPLALALKPSLPGRLPSCEKIRQEYQGFIPCTFACCALAFMGTENGWKDC